jgi:hypothetical protein
VNVALIHRAAPAAVEVADKTGAAVAAAGSAATPQVSTGTGPAEDEERHTEVGEVDMVVVVVAAADRYFAQFVRRTAVVAAEAEVASGEPASAQDGSVMRHCASGGLNLVGRRQYHTKDIADTHMARSGLVDCSSDCLRPW